MSKPKILVMGTSIAGPTAAYWLAKARASATVIEHLLETAQQWTEHQHPHHWHHCNAEDAGYEGRCANQNHVDERHHFHL